MEVVERNRPTMAFTPPSSAVSEAPNAAMSLPRNARIPPATEEPITAKEDQMVCEAQKGLVSGVLVLDILSFPMGGAAGRAAAVGRLDGDEDFASASASRSARWMRRVQPRPNRENWGR